MTKIALVDLFSGIGGFAEGLRLAGIEFEYHAFSEIAPGPISIYKKHFPEAEELGDVGAIRDFSRIKQQQGGVPLVVTAGFPCQDLSVAGKRRGLDGERSGLFFEAIRCIRELRPDVFIFENVKGLFTSHGGRDFVRFLQEIANLGGYDCQWQLVDTDWFLPQNRERVYFVGCTGAFSGRQIFPLQITASKSDRFIKKTKRALKWRPVVDVTSGTKNQNGRLLGEDTAFTLTTRPMQGVFDGEDIRLLTPIERERLQGFPDGWTQSGNTGKKMSDSVRYKATGNAVSVPAPEAIARALFN